MLRKIVKYKLIILLLMLTVNKRTSATSYANNNLHIPPLLIYNNTLIKIISLDTFLYRNAYIESRNESNSINRYGCIGLYQFDINTLESLNGRINVNKIKKSVKKYKNIYNINKYTFDTLYLNKSLQNELIRDYLTLIEFKYLKKSIKKYVGKKINGIIITKAGILAASFLGYHNVYKFLSSKGKINHKDGNGYSVKDRLKTFQFTEINSEEIYCLY
jgi:hypothetical protein